MKVNLEGYGLGEQIGDVIRTELDVQGADSVNVLLERFIASTSESQLTDAAQFRVVYRGKVLSHAEYASTTMSSLKVEDKAVIRVVRSRAPSSGNVQTASNSSAVTTPQSNETNASVLEDSSSRVTPTESAEEPKISVTQLQPNGSMTCGGVQVLVFGKGFREGARVRFGRTLVNAVRHSHDLLVCTAPAHAAGIVSVEVELSPERQRPRQRTTQGRTRPQQRLVDTDLTLSTQAHNDALFTTSGCTFTYIELADLDAAMTITCQAGAPAQAQQVCKEDQENYVQNPSGLM